MKNLKVALSSVCVLALALLIYFTSAGLSNNTPAAKEKPESGSTVCSYHVTVNSNGFLCLSGSYKYCINGGTTMTNTTGVIEVEVPCERLYTLCVESSSGCSGTIQLGGNCPCPDEGISTNIFIESGNPPCNCP
jgi:hypothetical protein